MISPGELTAGMNVTVLETSPITMEQIRGLDGDVMTQRQTWPADAFKGMPMKIVAVNLPYVILRAMGNTAILDTRVVKFMELTDDYVKAIEEIRADTPAEAFKRMLEHSQRSPSSANHPGQNPPDGRR
jgi:hypothetical protein